MGSFIDWFTYLRRKNYECHAYHDDHKKLWWPNVGHIISIPDGRERNYDIIHGLEQVQMPVASSLEMLNSAHTEK